MHEIHLIARFLPHDLEAAPGVRGLDLAEYAIQRSGWSQPDADAPRLARAQREISRRLEVLHAVKNAGRSEESRVIFDVAFLDDARRIAFEWDVESQLVDRRRQFIRRAFFPRIHR